MTTKYQQFLDNLSGGVNYILSQGVERSKLRPILEAAGIPSHQFYIQVKKMKAEGDQETLGRIEDLLAKLTLYPKVFRDDEPEEEESLVAEEEQAIFYAEPEEPLPPPPPPPISDQDAWNRVVSALVPLSRLQRSRVIASVQVYFDA